VVRSTSTAFSNPAHARETHYAYKDDRSSSGCERVDEEIDDEASVWNFRPDHLLAMAVVTGQLDVDKLCDGQDLVERQVFLDEPVWSFPSTDLLRPCSYAVAETNARLQRGLRALIPSLWAENSADDLVSPH
jgi:hypothetical protein